jgi:hypothetical protein
MGISISTYLVYQYLRQQQYRVIRHTSTRLPIILQQQQQQQQAAAPQMRQSDNHSVLPKKRSQNMEDNNDNQDTNECMVLSAISTEGREHSTLETPNSTGNDIHAMANDTKTHLHISNDTTNVNDSIVVGSSKTTTTTTTATMSTTTTTTSTTATNISSKQSLQSLKRLLRYDMSQAVPPVTYPIRPVVVPTNASSSYAQVLPIPSIAYDCYLPNSHFAPATPGIPNFYVTITAMDQSYSTPTFSHPKSLSFQQIQSLLEQCQIRNPKTTTTTAAAASSHSTTTTTTTATTSTITKSNDATTTHDHSSRNNTMTSDPTDDKDHHQHRSPTQKPPLIASSSNNFVASDNTVPTHHQHHHHHHDHIDYSIPLKVAAVSDSGTVIMFGIYNQGIPPNHL